jgi:nucleoside-diphosphate-sugar epimerase
MSESRRAAEAETRHVLVTGGAGYLGSLLAGVLLQQGWRVTVIDKLLFGGECLLGYWHHPRFQLVVADLARDDVGRHFHGVDAVVHLAAVVGFPACQAVGREAAWLYNVEATRRAFDCADRAGVGRFVFASTYSNYGLSANGEPVREDATLHPQSLYAETKIAAEELLLGQGRNSRCAPLVFRFATLYGISPRTRFDLIVNQFVLEAVQTRRLVIYQRGYSRSFVHVRDVAQGVLLALDASESRVRGEVYNLGSEAGNYTKDQIVALVKAHVPETAVRYENLSFGGDMRDLSVSFAKVRERLDFKARITVEQGVLEVRDALRMGLIKDPTEPRYRNAQFIVQ